MRRWILVLPILVFAGLAALFARGLDLDPREIDSPLIDKPAPTFALDGLGDMRGLSTEDLSGRVTLVNFFASWCVPCRLEHPLLMELARKGAVRIVGINYKDKPADALAWLAELGNPYAAVGVDSDGRAAIEWGVYGVPESYLVDRSGHIRFKHTGPLSLEVYRDTLMPLIGELSR